MGCCILTSSQQHLVYQCGIHVTELRNQIHNNDKQTDHIKIINKADSTKFTSFMFSLVYNPYKTISISINTLKLSTKYDKNNLGDHHDQLLPKNNKQVLPGLGTS